MEKEKTIENEFLDNIDIYSDFIKLSFKDLVKLTKEDKRVFLDLYYNRETELNDMKSILKNIRNRGDNILILGPAGTGKSSFIYKVFYEIGNLPQYNLHPLIVDYRDVVNKEYLYKHFIFKMKEFFEEIKKPVNTLKNNTTEFIQHNLHELKYHLSILNNNDFTKHLIILLDDFDYLKKDELFEVLETFQSFGVHSHATLVLSARPDLHSSIKEYDNRLEKTFTRDIQLIELKRLDIQNLITKRLSAIIHLDSARTGLFQGLWNRMLKQDSKYSQLLRKMGVHDIINLRKIKIPFTSLYLNFISKITNMNNREIFDIVHESIIYVLKNFNKIETRIEIDSDMIEHSKKVITKEDTLKLFFDNKESKFLIFNINEERSKLGNSLLFNVLEGVKTYKSVNLTFIEKMGKLGHSKQDIKFAISKLKSKKYTLIKPLRLVPSKVEIRVDRFPRYEITEKGNFYLSRISYWEEYQNRCGHFGQSLKNIK